MGDRTYCYYNCPNCKEINGVEVYDAPSSLLYGEKCLKCDWTPTPTLDYYEISDNEIVLCSRQEYNQNYKKLEWVQNWRNQLAKYLRKQRKELNV